MNGGNAHISLEKALDNLPPKLRGEKPVNLPYSIWQLTEHIRITQWDILEFSRNPHHVSPQWPDEYWPQEAAPDVKKWEKTLQSIQSDRNAFVALLEVKDADLFSPFEHADNGQNLFREAMLIADHTSYHIGQIIVLRRLLNNWE
ncbi:hypothetical protein FLA_2383 [Filimonas lacunae]|nr:hypothetical protein FLA_2383 [Filimonas lacunae]